MPYPAATAGQFSFDRSWFESINRLSRQTPWLHTPVRDFAEYGIVLFAALLLWSWWKARGTRDVAAVAASLWAPIGVLVAVGLNQPIANAVREPRPYDVLNHVLVLVSRSSDFSFPSDHGTMAGAVAAGVFLVNRRWGVVAALAALLMAFARVYVGAHFPDDVMAGLALGAVTSVVGYVLVGGLLRRLVEAMARTPLRPLVAAAPASGQRELETTGR